MKTFFKVLVIALLVVIAIKLCPLILLAATATLFVAGFLGTVGLTLLMGLLVIAGVALALLAPIWIPVLAIVGLMALFRKSKTASMGSVS